MRCLRSGKEATESAWWLPAAEINTQYECDAPYRNGRKMTRHDIPKLFKTLKNFARKFQLQPFSHDYVPGAIRKTGINILSLFGFMEKEVSAVR